MKVTKKSINEAINILIKNGVSEEIINLIKESSLKEIDRLNKIKKDEKEINNKKKYGKLIVLKYLNKTKEESISFENNGIIRFSDNDNRFRVNIFSKTKILVEYVDNGLLKSNEKSSNLKEKLLDILKNTNYK